MADDNSIIIVGAGIICLMLIPIFLILIDDDTQCGSRSAKEKLTGYFPYISIKTSDNKIIICECSIDNNFENCIDGNSYYNLQNYQIIKTLNNYEVEKYERST